MTLRQVLLLDGCNMNDASVQVLASSCLLLREVSIKDSLSCSDKAAELLLQVLLPCALLPPCDIIRNYSGFQSYNFISLHAAGLPLAAQIRHAGVQRHHEGRQIAARFCNSAFMRHLFAMVCVLSCLNCFALPGREEAKLLGQEIFFRRLKIKRGRLRMFELCLEFQRTKCLR